MVNVKSLARRLFGDVQALKEKQSGYSRVAQLHREFAEHPTKGITPAKLHQILEAAEQGDLKAQSELFDDMEERDAQIGADIGKRRQLAAELEWQIVPPDNANRQEKKAADQAAEVFAGLEVEDLIINLGAGIGHGWVNLELPWQLDGSERFVEQPIFRPHSWFRLHPEDQNRITLRDNSADGADLWALGWVQHRHRAKPGYIARSGLHRQLAWPYLFKHYSLSDLAELLEIYGLPMRLGKYPSNAEPKDKAALLRAVTSLGHNAGGIIPDGMSIDFMTAAGAAGSAEMFELMINWCERTISKSILGGTLTSGTGDGTNTNALGNVHERGQDSIIRADGRQYAGSIKRSILWPMAAMNYGIENIRRAPQFYLETEDANDYKGLSESLPTFVDMGMNIPKWWAHEKSGIPEAAEGDEVLKPRAPAAITPESSDIAVARFGAHVAALSTRATELTPAPEQMLPQTSQRVAPAVNDWIEQIRKLSAEVESLEELRDRLLELYPDMTLDQYATAMAEALGTANLAGRNEVIEEQTDA